MPPGVGCVEIAHAEVFSGVPGAPGLQNPVAVGVARPPQVFVEGFESVGKPLEESFVPPCQKIYFQGRGSEVVALQMPVIRRHVDFRPVENPRGRPPRPVPAAFARPRAGANQGRRPAVRALIHQENELIIQGNAQVAFGIHLTAHRLRFQKHAWERRRFYQRFHRGGKLHDVDGGFGLGGIKETLQEPVAGFEDHARGGEVRAPERRDQQGRAKSPKTHSGNPAPRCAED